MTLNQLFGVAMFVAVSALIGWAFLTDWRQRQRFLRRDPPLFIDQWTDESRKRLAALNHPAQKGFAAQRKGEK